MGLKRSTKPKFFEQIGRALLGRLLERFQSEFTSHGLALPKTGLDIDRFV